MSRAFVLLFVALFGTQPALALMHGGRPGWTEYRNDRFGLVMRYPSAVFDVRRSSASGDGDLFETPDGRARLLVGAIENADHFTPRSYQSFIARQSYPGLRVDYAPVGQSWAVLSGTIGQTMIYEKIMFSCGGEVINSFAMTYPVAERRFYDPLIEDIENTFRPRAHGCGQHASRF
jgi:hypothetical protein